MVNSNLRGVGVKPLAAALALALSAASITAAASTSTGSAFATHMQALHNAVAQLKQYRSQHPGKPQLLPGVVPHKLNRPQRHPALPAVTQTVTICTDGASSATTPGTLRYAVLNATASSSIDLSACNNSTITLSQGALPVTVDNLTLTAGFGNHVTIDGNGADRVFYDTATGSGSLNLKYLTVQNGVAQPSYTSTPPIVVGGCIFAQNEGVAMSYSTVTGCQATNAAGSAEGGGVAAYGLFMYRSTISGNTVSATKSNPTASGKYGAAGGGAVAAGYNAYSTALIYSQISNNTVQASGEPVFADAGGLLAIAPYLLGSTISANRVQVGASTSSSQPSIGLGGGLSAKYGATINSSTIRGNSVTCANASGGPLTVFCLGGGVASSYFNNSSTPVLDISYSTISGNHSDFFAGGVLSKYSSTIVQSTISGNTAGIGAGLLQKYIGGSGASVYNSTIAANNANYAGGGVYVYAGGPSGPVPPPITLVSSIVARNAAGYYGGDLYLRSAYTQTIAGSNDLVMDATPNIALPAGTLSADPMLAPLSANGGPTLTMGLYPGSPALSTGINPNNYAFDQRGTGFPRETSGLTDIGAFQGTVAPPVPAPALSTWALALLTGLLGFIGWRRRRIE
jgi:hypothetical protein